MIKIKEYKIIYKNTKGAINSNPSYYTKEDLPLILKPLKKDKFKFIGWLNEEEKIVEEVTVTDETDTMLYAMWEDKSSGEEETGYKDVVFNSNTSMNVTNMPKNSKVEFGDNFIMPSNIPLLNGYTFLNWNTKKDNTGDKIYPKETLNNVREDINLFAIWKKTTNKIINSNPVYRCICCGCRCNLNNICNCDKKC